MAPNNSILTDYAYNEILRMILSTEIAPGSRIREDFLAEQLGISRTPVREAVNRLIQNGFIINIIRKGLYCVNFSRRDLLNLTELRLALESLSFEKCIDLATDEDIAGFQRIIDDFQAQLSIIVGHDENVIGKEIAMLHNEYDIRFHVGVAQISASTRLIRYVNEVENMLLIARQRIYSNSNRVEIVQLSWEQHQRMCYAIRSRDKDAARDLLGEHLKLMIKTQINIVDSADEIVESVHKSDV
ncbi:MAG: GntR family transcriptional regulator [Treponema sp.]|jgi:DNA-binding GntR family transcriptional regulator|nr:GntR family transcriptional regulator [Treponema sp.]